MTIRLIASDLDGTLLNGEASLTPRTIRALAAARQRHIVVAAATGRSHRSAVPRISSGGCVDWAVCSNGATIYDVVAGEVVLHRTMSPGAVDDVFEAVTGALPDVGLAWEMPEGFGFDARFAEHRPSIEEMRPHWAAEPSSGRVRPSDALKLLVSHPELGGPALLRALEPHVPHTVTMTNSGAAFVEITDGSVDKATTLALLCHRLGIDPSEVVAFGDAHNDLAMLRWAGASVAMGNAHADAVAVATHRAESNIDDGVARMLHTLGLVPDT